MHPGPMNRGVEIAAEVAEGPASLITEQVTNGVAVRMAVLYSLLGSGGLACLKPPRATPDQRRRASSTSTANVSPTCWSAAGTSPRSAAGSAATRRSTPSGCIVAPGLVDLHVHLREPGMRKPRRSRPAPAPRRSVASPPSSRCPTRSPRSTIAAVVASVLAAGEHAVRATVVSSGCITKGRAGEELAPMGELYAPRRADLHRRRRLRRRRRRDAAGARVRARHLPARWSRSTPKTPALAGGGAHARGRVVEPARHPRAGPRPPRT